MEHAPELRVLCGVNFIDKVVPREMWGPDDPYGPTQRMTFERVAVHMRSVDRTVFEPWTTEHFWKRIS